VLDCGDRDSADGGDRCPIESDILEVSTRDVTGRRKGARQAEILQAPDGPAVSFSD
jgi:hypothetical protein